MVMIKGNPVSVQRRMIMIDRTFINMTEFLGNEKVVIKILTAAHR